MNEDTQPNEINAPKRIAVWKVVTGFAIVIACYLAFSPSHKTPTHAAIAQVEAQAQEKIVPLTVDQTTMVEAKKAYKPKSIRENLARAKEIMSGFKEKPGEEMVDRMDRMNKYVLEATKEDVKYPTK